MPFTIEEDSPRDEFDGENESNSSGGDNSTDSKSDNSGEEEDGGCGSHSGGRGGSSSGAVSGGNGGALRRHGKKSKERRVQAINRRCTAGKSTEWHEKTSVDDPEDDFVLL